ncbi:MULTISPECIES: NUDIX hydrolase [Edwardsiella]|uniref:Dihydroneopterin triphosphate pyrophosphohydolase, putative, Actinobacterial type, NudB-like protein n=2 Tax=Edwardsiella anguillarum TaxID=1821960 RepID=A0A076LTP5_9GAMM|nr:MULTISPECIES: NUDIX domain-containing protein [Edwardsiella]GAJ68780.1 hydrolase, NUDIX family [Edwardsiella piscicida]AIJ10037.1 Dihydroneopterin triphosphate pyrophosphohydolase, putative, Actinobacterial type, NudB-like protein [Edwardsiella anguillarum ET080813]AKR77662.1 NUDIX domain-containing protein [Edwardsiella sp. LADL05-105]KAB0589760.1 NUDIX domain-containing protein [Edwardsiella anguillarum]RFT03745.1 NUDIX hydrolase [Edwardsiella anguillarum]
MSDTVRRGERFVTRHAVRVILIDSNQSVLLLSTKDASNPDFIESWEVPGGGANPNESIHETAIREILEETGIKLTSDDLSNPLWKRDVLYSYRGERRLQHETICIAHINKSSPRLNLSGREPFETEDHQRYKWWSVKELQNTRATLYPKSLGTHITALINQKTVEEPIEIWD